jgi:hypothetical protein
MSEKSHEDSPATSQDRAEQQEEMDEVQQRLDAESDEAGLGAEAGRAEENGISQG